MMVGHPAPEQCGAGARTVNVVPATDDRDCALASVSAVMEAAC
jgi:hypothetical protein